MAIFFSYPQKLNFPLKRVKKLYELPYNRLAVFILKQIRYKSSNNLNGTINEKEYLDTQSLKVDVLVDQMSKT